MSAFCGAWSLSGEPADRVLLPQERRVMLEAAGRGLESMVLGPLWLAAPRESSAERDGRALAWAGYLTFRARAGGAAAVLDDCRRGVPPDLEGHYALAYAESAERRLTLFRDAFGAERVFYAVVDDLLLFSTSVKPMLAGGRIRTRLDRDVAAECVLSGDMGVVFGSRTLFDGILELRLGETLSAEAGRITRRRPSRWAPTRSRGPLATPADLRRALREATGAAIGGDRRVAVALSGGMDSSTLAVLAVELAGSSNVEAFTYEYDDPSHPRETRYAAALCRRLGIRHHVVTVTAREYLDLLPELFGRLEAPRLMPGAYLPLARRVRERGFSKLLTGHGVEAMLGIREAFESFENIARALRCVPRPGWTLRYWKARRFFGWPIGRIAALLHPGLRPPLPFLHYLVVCGLRHNGVIEDASRFYPAPLAPWIREIAESPRVSEAVSELAGLPLAEQLERLTFDYHRASRLMRGKQAAFAQAGAAPVCPALFFVDLHAPVDGARPLGRAVHRAAMAGELPEEILRRPKLGEQAIIPKRWVGLIARELAPLAPEAAARLRPGSDEARAALLRHFPADLALLGLWSRVCVDRPLTASIPSWGELGIEPSISH